MGIRYISYLLDISLKKLNGCSVLVNDPPSAERKVDFAVFFIFFSFYGLMVGKYALICTMEIQKIHMVVHIFSGFALFTELM